MQLQIRASDLKIAQNILCIRRKKLEHYTKNPFFRDIQKHDEHLKTLREHYELAKIELAKLLP